MKERPNILLFLVDDMGVHQAGCYGSGFYETPHIDQLAREGVRFTGAYSASPVCSPSRAAIYTGQHPARLKLTNYIPGTVPDRPRLLTPDWRPYLPVEVPTLGDVFKAAGYDTAHFGKWHLAPDYHYRPGRPMDPESQGFDTVVVTRKPQASDDAEADAHHVDELTRHAVRFLDAPRDRPFLCVVAHNALHRPELAPAALVAKYAAKPGVDGDGNRPVIAAMMEGVDRSLGTLLERLRKTGQERDTVVIFTSDHGAFGRSAHLKPLRGAKADLYEGGLRVPLIWRWPGRFAPGERPGPVLGTDLFPTLVGLCGLKAETPGDGVCLRETLTQPTCPPPDRPALAWHFPHYHHLGLAPCGAIRVGPWKLIEWFDRSIGGATDGAPYELYHLEHDPAEQHNLASMQTELCAVLASRLRRWRMEVGAQEMVPNPEFDPAAPIAVVPPPPGDPGNPFGE